jgi:hypothetical protein
MAVVHALNLKTPAFSTGRQDRHPGRAAVGRAMRGKQGSSAVSWSAAGSDSLAEYYVDLGGVAGGGVAVFSAIET